MRDIRGKEDEPSARLCPLRWTAIGRIGKSEQRPQSANTGYLNTFRAQLASPDMLPTILEANEADLNTTLKRFWDLETIGITAQTSKKQWYDPRREVRVEESRAVLNVQWGTV